MKIKEIQTDNGPRYLFLDDNYEIVEEVMSYLKFLDAKGASPNTLKNYAHHLKIFYVYMNACGMNVLLMGNSISMNPVHVLTGFLEYLNGKPLPEKIIQIHKKKRSAKTINTIMDTVLRFYKQENNMKQYLNCVQIIETGYLLL